MTAVVVALAAIAAALWIAQRLGRVRAERDFREKAHADEAAAAARARRIDEDVARLGDGELARRLRAFRRGGVSVGAEHRAGFKGQADAGERPPDPRP